MSVKKTKLSGKVIVIAILLLCLIIGITAYINMSGQNDSSDGYSLTISRNKTDIVTYSIDELKKMPSVTVEAELSSGSKDDVEGSFTGVPVKDILETADSGLPGESENIIFIAGDGYSSALTLDEVEKEDTIVAFEVDGKSMEHFNDGGFGPLRLIVGSDTYGNRSIQYLVKIECTD